MTPLYLCVSAQTYASTLAALRLGCANSRHGPLHDPAGGFFQMQYCLPGGSLAAYDEQDKLKDTCRYYIRADLIVPCHHSASRDNPASFSQQGVAYA